tara:strand:+ start:232 stop:480 length:249 start_codon:yes stop_codon:yes gene_type:complete
MTNSLQISKKTDNEKKKKKPRDLRKWLLIGSSLAKLAGGTDYNEAALQAYQGRTPQGDKGYIKPDTGNGNGKKKKKRPLGGY